MESIHKETVSTEAMEQDEDYEGHEALFEFMNQGEECKKELENLFITFEDFQVQCVQVIDTAFLNFQALKEVSMTWTQCMYHVKFNSIVFDA